MKVNIGEKSPILKLGPIVRIVLGREAGQYAVGKDVVDDRYVLLADGEQ